MLFQGFFDNWRKNYPVFACIFLHIDSPLKRRPAIIHLRQQQSKKLCPYAVFLHLFIEAVFLHKLYTVCQISDLLSRISAGHEVRICIFYCIVMLFAFLHCLAVLLSDKYTAVRKVIFQNFKKSTDLIKCQVHK